jgi:hypothetical protein
VRKLAPAFAVMLAVTTAGADPLPSPKPRPFFAARAGIGYSLLYRPNHYSVAVVGPGTASGAIVVDGTRGGSGLTVHGGIGIAMSERFSAGVEYRMLDAHANRRVGALGDLGYSLEPEIRLFGWGVYGQGRVGHFVGSGRFELTTLTEKIPQSSYIVRSIVDHDRGWREDTYALGGSVGFTSSVGAFPSAFGFHAALDAGLVGFNPITPIKLFFPGWYGPQPMNEFIGAATLGAEVGLDFN